MIEDVMRKIIDLVESFDEEGEGEDFSSLPPSSAIRALIPAFVKVAQAQYDKWTVGDDEDGFDMEYAGGGICHLIADDLCDIMGANGIACSTVSSTHEQHVYCVAQCSDGVFEVDVPWRNYETGGGFTWKRIEGVTFDQDYIHIYRLSPDPSEFEQYVGD